MKKYLKASVRLLTLFIFHVSYSFAMDIPNEIVEKMYPPGEIPSSKIQVERDYRLLQAVEKMDAETIIRALKDGGNPNIRHPKYSPYEGMLEYFLRQLHFHTDELGHYSIEVKWGKEGKWIPAMTKGREVVEKFIDSGARLSIPYPVDYVFEGCALYFAIVIRNLPIIRLLVNAGANPDTLKTTKIDERLCHVNPIMRTYTDLSLLDCAKYQSVELEDLSSQINLLKVFKELLRLGGRNTLKKPGSLISAYIQNLDLLNWSNSNPKSPFLTSCTEDFQKKAVTLCLCLNKHGLPKDLRILLSKHLAKETAEENLAQECFRDEKIIEEILEDKKNLLGGSNY